MLTPHTQTDVFILNNIHTFKTRLRETLPNPHYATHPKTHKHIQPNTKEKYGEGRERGGKGRGPES